MVNIDPFTVASFGVLFLGALLVGGGLYARRGGRLRNRQGAEVLAGFVAVIGVLVMGVGVYVLLSVRA